MIKGVQKICQGEMIGFGFEHEGVLDGLITLDLNLGQRESVRITSEHSSQQRAS